MIEDVFQSEISNICDQTSVHECRGYFVREDDGSYSAHCMNLAGIHTDGDNLDEAVENLKNAFRGTVQVYNELGKEIPWRDHRTFECDVEGKQRWIIVDV